MAIRILLDHDVPEDNIYLLSLLMSEPGVHALAYAFPKVKIWYLKKKTWTKFNRISFPKLKDKKTSFFPKKKNFQVRLITTAVDQELSENFYVLPGMGNFGDRYYGTCMSDDEDYWGVL